MLSSSPSSSSASSPSSSSCTTPKSMPQKQTTTKKQDTSIAGTEATAELTHDQDNNTIQDLWTTLDRELRINIGNSVRCGICWGTVDDGTKAPLLTPCVHLFCRQCVSKMEQTKCPTCQQACVGGRRSWTTAPQSISALASVYKQALVEFGWTPAVVQSSFTTLTQQPTTTNSNNNPLSVQDLHNAWAVSKTWQDQVHATTSSPKRLLFVQENAQVVQANQRAYQEAVEDDWRAHQAANRVCYDDSSSQQVSQSLTQPYYDPLVFDKNKTKKMDLNDPQKKLFPQEEEKGRRNSFMPPPPPPPKEFEVTQRRNSFMPPPVPESSQGAAAASEPRTKDTETNPDKSPVQTKKRNSFMPPSPWVPLAARNEPPFVAQDCSPISNRPSSSSASKKAMLSALLASDDEDDDDTVAPSLSSPKETSSKPPSPKDSSVNAKPSPAFDTKPSAASSNLENESLEEHTSPPKENLLPPPPPGFAVGSLVVVAPRMGPGQNQPGGVARVTAVHHQPDKRVVRYNVKYVVGTSRTEKGIDACFVHPYDMADANDDQRRRSRRARHQEDALPLALLQELAHQGFDTAGMLPTMPPVARKKKKPVLAARGNGEKAPKRSNSKKRQAPEEKNPSKKVKTTPSTADAAFPCKADDVQVITERALAYYKSKWQSLQDKASSRRVLVHVVASNLSQADQALLKAMCAQSAKADKGLQWTVQSTVTSHTKMCLTAAAATHQGRQQALVRTAKTMQCALAGIPIVSSAWLSSSTNGGVIPSDLFYVSSLPTKTVTEDYCCGVFWQAAKLAESCPSFLQDVKFYLVGKTSAAAKKDMHLLIQQGGGSLLKTPSALQKELATTSLIVVLCQETTGGLKIDPAVQAALRKERLSSTVLVVRSGWLFDSIACGKFLSADSFEPLQKGPAQELWKLWMDRNTKS